VAGLQSVADKKLPYLLDIHSLKLKEKSPISEPLPVTGSTLQQQLIW
jgi:hypothetical protein